MPTITVDKEVYGSLEKQVRTFGETPNDVLRRILDIPDNKMIRERLSDGVAHARDRALVEFVNDGVYLNGDAKHRYFAVLRFLLTVDAKTFSKLEGFKRQTRVNISRSADEIEKSGNNTFPEKLSNTPYYIMTNLDNKSKRTVLDHALRLFGFNLAARTAVENSIPDSDILRTRVNRYV